MVEEAVVERTPTRTNLVVSLGVRIRAKVGVKVRARPTHVTKDLAMLTTLLSASV